MDEKTFLAAIAAGEIENVRAALCENPELGKARTSEGASAVQWAVYNRHIGLAGKLIESGAELDFWSACTVGRLAAVPEGTDVNALSPDGFTPLALTVAFGHNDIATLLITRGADVNARSRALGGVAPIHAAIFGRNLEGIKLLKEAGADLDAPQEGGFTALHGAAQNGDLEMVSYLLKNGADPDAKTEEGKLPLDFAEAPELKARLTK
jgi:uncharacterized protein